LTNTPRVLHGSHRQSIEQGGVYRHSEVQVVGGHQRDDVTRSVGGCAEVAREPN
ncbi:unnamed protein product, partial [Plutella xylostella]